MPEPRALSPLNLEDPSPYLVTEPARIRHLLGRLAKRPELIGLYPPGRYDQFALSALLDIGDAHLVFDTSPDERTNKLLLNGAHMTCVSGLDRVHIQFDAPRPVSVVYENRPALQTAVPTSLLFVQRRDYYRLSVPARYPLFCRIPLENDQFVDAEVADISLGGISLLGPLPGFTPHPGLRLTGCQLDLPEVGTVSVDLLVCTTHDISLRHSNRTLRIGCRFLHLNGGQQTRIQRYINHLERSRISLE